MTVTNRSSRRETVFGSMLLIDVLHRLRTHGRGGPGLVRYAATAAHRAGDPAVACRILGCDDEHQAVHVAAFDRSAGHRDALAAAAMRVRTRRWVDGG